MLMGTSQTTFRPELDDEIARLAAGRTPLALTRNPNLRSRLHAGRHRHADPSPGAHLAASIARRTGRIRYRAASQAVGTGPLDREGALSEGHSARTLALDAVAKPSARGGSAPVARRARLYDRYGDVDLTAPRGRPERDLDEVLDVLATALGLWPFRRALAEVEDRAEQVAQPPTVTQVLEAESPRLGSAAGRAASPEAEAAEAPHLIVLLALIVVRQDTVGLGDLLEPLGRHGVIRVGIRMILLGQLAVSLLELVGSGFVADAENLVVVLGPRRHQASSPSTASSSGGELGGPYFAT
jgi:hypothetical protein